MDDYLPTQYCVGTKYKKIEILCLDKIFWLEANFAGKQYFVRTQSADSAPKQYCVLTKYFPWTKVEWLWRRWRFWYSCLQRLCKWGGKMMEHMIALINDYKSATICSHCPVTEMKYRLKCSILKKKRICMRIIQNTKIYRKNSWVIGWFLKRFHSAFLESAWFPRKKKNLL